MDLRPDLNQIPMLQRCVALSREPALSMGQIRGAIDHGAVLEQHLEALMRPDPRHPYGRQVLIQTGVLESMLATWTPGVRCAPHDHGGSIGGVRVLSGASDHRMFKVADGTLVEVFRERVESGRFMACGPDIIHSMGDAGGAKPLVTLHLYTAPIDHMVVYDLERSRTLVVDGGCGAWLPYDEPHLIRHQVEGIHAWGALGLRQPEARA